MVSLRGSKQPLAEKLLVRAVLVAAAMLVTVSRGVGIEPTVPTSAANSADEVMPRYRLIRSSDLEISPAGYRVVTGGFGYFVLEKLERGNGIANTSILGRMEHMPSRFLGG